MCISRVYRLDENQNWNGEWGMGNGEWRKRANNPLSTIKYMSIVDSIAIDILSVALWCGSSIITSYEHIFFVSIKNPFLFSIYHLYFIVFLPNRITLVSIIMVIKKFYIKNRIKMRYCEVGSKRSAKSENRLLPLTK